jgi:hypothetical protein
MTYHWTFSADDAKRYGAGRLLDLECLQQYFNRNLDNLLIAERLTAQSDVYFFDHATPPDYDCVDEVIDDWQDEITDAGYEISSIETDIPAPDSRHYESQSVAMLCCGHWVGWTEWSGGGKHGNPEGIDIDPYLLKVTDQRLVTVTEYTFALLEQTP